MKNIILIIVSGFILLGCTVKTQTDINPYVTLHKNDKQNIEINFLGVNDKRATLIASKIMNDGEVQSKYPLNIDVKEWYTEAFLREFENAGISVNKQDSNMGIMINIQNIDAQYKQYSLDTKNMQAKVKIEIIITKGTKTTTSNIVSSQTVYKPMILDAEGFESVLNESMQSSVSKAVRVIIEKNKGL
ncbi:MAG: YajG family lipoprotein [Arcobacteraceae bacterium]